MSHGKNGTCPLCRAMSTDNKKQRDKKIGKRSKVKERLKKYKGKKESLDDVS